MEHVAAQFDAISAAAEARQPQRQLVALLEQAMTLCRHTDGLNGQEAQRRLLAHLTTVLQTWRDVWPRLGTQREFRLAVAREARLWAQRLRSPLT